MTLSAMPVLQVIGCDVGKDAIVVYDSLSGQVTELANRPETLKDFVAPLAQTALIVCEATGGYEADLLLAAVAAGVPAHRADARRVKAFIRSLGCLGKTDRLDARGLARYGLERHADLPRWRPAGAGRDALRTLVRLRAQLVKQRTALTNQLKAPGAAAAKPHLTTLIKAIAERIAAVDTDIAELVDRQPAIAQTVHIIRAIPGCGPVTAVTVAALMPELGTLTGRQAAALAGLAPHPHQSGHRDGYRRTRGGRTDLKRALFMAAMAARNHNPTLSAVYKRLVDNGKKPIVAITALMRKLITIINAKVRDAFTNTEIELS